MEKITDKTRQKYFSILEGISKEENESITINDRILIVDGLNLFIRSYAACPVVSEQGEHMGGVSGALASIGYAINITKPTRLIITFDGKDGSQYRRKLFPGYKSGRKTHVNVINSDFCSTKEEENESMSIQLRCLYEFLELLPCQTMAIDKIEADDVIAYISKYFVEQHKSKVFIMSTDKDYLQLIDENISVWSPTKKKIYTDETVKEEFGLHAKNFILMKSLLGDSSDSIPGISGLGLKTMVKRLPFLFEKDEKFSLNDIFNYTESKTKEAIIYDTIVKSKEQIELNYKIMQLHDVEISGTIKEKILNILDSNINRLSKHLFIAKLVSHGLQTTTALFKAPDNWLQKTFFKLDNFASQYNK